MVMSNHVHAMRMDTIFLADSITNNDQASNEL